MTETDTSREAVERDAEYWEGWAADIRANNGSVADAANMDAICARYRALLARAEKAEAERDTAWSDALDAAIDHFCEEDICAELDALKKGDTT